MTFPLTVGEHTTVQAGLITFPKEILPFLEEGHTFSIEGSLSGPDKGRRVVAINLSIDVFNEEDEDPTPTQNTKE